MKKKINDNKTIREKSIKKLLIALLQIEFTPSATLHKTMLTEVLINGKSFSELKETVQLTTFRQKIILENAVNTLTKGLNDFNLKLKFNKYEEIILRSEEKILALENMLKAREESISVLKPLLSIPIKDVGFSIRVKQICLLADINTVSDLVRLSKGKFHGLRNCGKKSLKEADEFLIKNGLSWNMKI